jgi:phosphoribosylglycinamide formyltransferase-1
VSRGLIRLAFLASRNGSSFRRIVEAIEAGGLAARPVLLAANRADAGALAFARARDIPAIVIPTAADPHSADRRLARALAEAGADFVILSGYLRRLGPETLKIFKDRVLNIHPALLPRHGGAGFYGRRVHEAVIASGDSESGATVHLVDHEFDHGPVLAQRRLAVEPGETAESLERRVMALEPELFIETLQALIAGKLTLPVTPVDR